MRTSRIIASALFAALLWSCSGGAKIDGTVTDTPDVQIRVTRLDRGVYVPVDTIKTDSYGRYSCKVPVKKGDPEFIYLFYKDTRVGSLLLQNGDKVRVTSDTLGNYSVDGSAETIRLHEVERSQQEFLSAFSATAARLQDMDQSSPEAALLRRNLTKQYVDYYRGRVKYLLENPYSLTVVPVLYQVIGDGFPLFNQNTDAIRFRNACDSLSTVYPNSRYVKALADEADRRANLMRIGAKLEEAEEVSFPDINLPDINGKRTPLSSVESKLVMIYFWATDAGQNIFNTDVIKPLYEKYHDKGFEVYAVSLDTDKTAWATVVKNQKLPWVNVCDGLGFASHAAMLYQVSSLPTAHFVLDGTLVGDASVRDSATLGAYLAKTLK